MLNSFSKVTRTGYGKRIGQSIGGVLIGFLLFMASFVLLYWNEGRQDMSLIAKTATVIDSSIISTDQSLQENLVSVTGELTAEEQLADDYLIAGDYIALQRTVEIYAWAEDAEEESTTQTGGSETTKTKYSYEKQWTAEPQNSTDFEYPNEHYNPTKSIDDASKMVNSAKVGVYSIDVDSIDLPGYSDLSLEKEIVLLSDKIAGSDLYTDIQKQETPKYLQTSLEGDYVYFSLENPSNPEIGDIRISYQVVPANINVTVFGKLAGNSISAYVDEDDNELYRIIKGSHEQAVSTMHTEHVSSTWFLRIIGFILMWIGLSMIFGPISAVLDFLPFMGQLSRSLIGIMTCVVSIILTVVTICISMVMHSWVALLLISTIGVISVALLLWGVKKNKTTTPGPENTPPSTPTPSNPGSINQP